MTEEDFRDLALAYFARLHADGGRHAEIFFDPETHTDRGLPFSIAIDGLLAGMKEAEAKYGITSKLIMCFLRHLDEASSFRTLKSAEPYLDRIAGVGLDSSEKGHPPSKFARVFAAAREQRPQNLRPRRRGRSARIRPRGARHPEGRPHRPRQPRTGRCRPHPPPRPRRA